LAATSGCPTTRCAPSLRKDYHKISAIQKRWPIASRVALSLEHRLDDALYREAEKLLGAKGIMDAVILTGVYHTVCAILNAFEIPAPSSVVDASVTESTLATGE